MCGIVGIFSKNSILNRSLLVEMRDAIKHRGPDDAGIWWSDDGCIGLGHRRLSIVDLSAAGQQPMKDISGEVLIVLNGEIYNFLELREILVSKGHCFRSHSDTEVLLAAYCEWGTECLSRLNGMFAFVIYDSRKQQVFMARDRAGEKPFFYVLADGTLRFASELKGLMVDKSFSRRIDPESLDCYLAMGFVPGGRCILKGINKLLPAHAMVFNLRNRELKIWRYWELPSFEVASGFDEEALLDELEALLADSVRRQMVADVPVGVLLSGGLDSSLLTALAVRGKQKVKTFTIRFTGYAKYDETEHARLIARHFGTEHTELDAGESTVDLLPRLASQFDEPIVDSSMIPTYLVSKLVRKHCTVALGGDGGDELFGGYIHYNRLLWMSKNLGRIPLSLRLVVANAAEALLPVGFKGRNWLQGLGTDFERGLPLIATYFDKRMRCNLKRGVGIKSLIAEKIRENRVPLSIELLDRATRMDFENYLAEDILVKVDRASMLNSLEVRAPFLDYRLCEFAFGKVPGYLKSTSISRKVFLKKLAARILPSSFNQDRKQGFSIPLGEWLQGGPWLEFFKGVLLDEQSTLFNHKAIAHLFSGQSKGLANSERLFALVLFELWRREYKVLM